MSNASSENRVLYDGLVAINAKVRGKVEDMLLALEEMAVAVAPEREERRDWGRQQGQVEFAELMRASKARETAAILAGLRRKAERFTTHLKKRLQASEGSRAKAIKAA